jgi:hypothetical protein
MAQWTLDEFYARLVNEEDARVCREIPDEACREVPKNFFLLIGSYVLTKLGDAVANPKTTLTWMMEAIGVLLLVLGGMGAVAQVFSVLFVVLVLSVLGLAGAVMSWSLPEVT